MITIPIFNTMLLPDVAFYFKKDALPDTALSKAGEGEDILFMILKSDKHIKDVTEEDFYPIGVSAYVDSIDDSEGTIRICTKERVRLSDIENHDGEITATAAIEPDLEDISDKEASEIFENLKNEIFTFVQSFPWGLWARGFISRWRNLNEMICMLANYTILSNDERYAVLAEDSRKKRAELIRDYVYEFMELAKVNDEAESAQKKSNDKLYKEAALKKQIEYLQSQLDDMHPENISDTRKFEKKIKESGMNEEARREAEKVLNRMKQEGKDGHEYGMLYDYLDFMTTLSWKAPVWKDIDLDYAEKVLDEQHYGLKKVKDRILQQLAVMALTKAQTGSILLFVGAPGTGKTSIGQSIARALGREYVRISLGGVRDEAEIRGHRRTYIGAMPGRIMEGMKRSGSSNPVMVLDEVDKLASDLRGDPSSALLEVLDPEQNHTFTDHYMNVPYDLSRVLFVCTANSTDTIPEPLLNRMEVIQFPGYTATDKFQIAKQHLLPNAMKSAGIKAQNLKVTDDALERIIAGYTMEAGVRGLKKQMDILCRSAAVKLVRGEQKSLTVSARRVPEFLGRDELNHEAKLSAPIPGVVTGMAWTKAGGEILFIETLLTKGSGKLQITGQLGDVMKESAQLALSFVKARFPEESELLKEHDLHIHVPAGAVPKDGPSAGITLTTALASLLTGKGVDPETAMTGEISLRGCVMPIGGLPEKLMAAQRAGIKRALIPKANVKDLEDVAEEVRSALEIVPVETIEEVLDLLLNPKGQ